MGMLTSSRLLRTQRVRRRSGAASRPKALSALAGQRWRQRQSQRSGSGSGQIAPASALLILADDAGEPSTRPAVSPAPSLLADDGAPRQGQRQPTLVRRLVTALRGLVSPSPARQRDSGASGQRPPSNGAASRVAAIAIALSVVVLVAARTFATFGTAPPLRLASQEAGALLYDRLVDQAWRTPADGSVGEERRPSVRRYVVAEGDTLGGLAIQYGLSLDSIVSFNGIRDARALPVGSTLLLPPVSGIRYEVRRGDTLSGIASRYGVNLNGLLDANELGTQTIVPGQTLLIPGGRLPENAINRVLGRLFVAPARGRISSRYGYRNDPYTGLRRFHNGIDLAGAAGSPIYAAMRGTVALVGYNGIYGRYAIVRHADRYQSLYAHLQSVAVARGDAVRQGQQIGAMGDTGYSTGTHLHFSVFYDGEHVDPLPLID